MSTFDIAAWLNRNGIPTPYGKSRNKNGWSNNSVHRLLIHLLPNGIRMTQEDIEDRMIEMYYPNRKQVTLFDDNLNSVDYVAQAYRRKNAEIGYSIEEKVV